MKTIKVFYMPEQTAKGCTSFSPSAGKPDEVVKSWIEQGYPIEIVSFEPLTREQLYQAHAKTYIDGLLDCTIANGFGNTSESVAASLPYTTGSFVAAALHAFKTGETTASPTSGFHHALWDRGSGFCSIEGLAISVVMLLKAGAKKVGIFDLDAHTPQTMDIIERLGLQDRVFHYSFGGAGVSKRNAADWLKSLSKNVCKAADCDVLLFQAGADPHIDDPLGGALTSEQMRMRDRIVFQCAKRLGIPVAWNLAGGYQDPLQKVLDIHDATMEECVRVYGKSE